MLKRTALVLTLAAALVAAAPTAPASPPAGDGGSGQPAWGYFMYGKSTVMSVASTIACGLTPLGLGLGGVPGAVFGVACGFTNAA